jgi:hypothetical protein
LEETKEEAAQAITTNFSQEERRNSEATAKTTKKNKWLTRTKQTKWNAALTVSVSNKI